MPNYLIRLLSLAALSTALIACSGKTTQENAHETDLLNVSYDVSRGFYQQYNPLFEKEYAQKHPGSIVRIWQSHGGSSKQALAVANGLQADVVTMNQVSDIKLLQHKGLVKNDWAAALPDHAVPFTSVTVFLVRKGNPKHIRDWDDLIRPDVKAVAANPKTSGNGRYVFLAAYGNALREHNGDQQAAADYLRALYRNIPILDTGSRSSTTNFVQRQIGDVLLTFENEAQITRKEFADQGFEVIYPKYSVLAENPVAVVSAVTEKNGKNAAAQEYLQYLWSTSAQELAAQDYLRPADKAVLAAHAADFPPIETFRPTDVFGSWDEIMKNLFADGGLFDQISLNKTP